MSQHVFVELPEIFESRIAAHFKQRGTTFLFSSVSSVLQLAHMAMVTLRSRAGRLAGHKL
jgi:hypothetical protein